MNLRVETHISGSHCVVWRNKEHYLDCRKTMAYGTPATTIEAVRNGQVYRSIQVLNTEAPEMIIQFIREELM